LIIYFLEVTHSYGRSNSFFSRTGWTIIPHSWDAVNYREKKKRAFFLF